MVEHKKKSKTIFKFSKDDFSREKFIEGGIIRPAVLMTSFLTFIIGMFFLISRSLEGYRWGGSFIIFSFTLNLFAIYESLKDKPSVFRTLNLSFKIILFILEIIAFNYLLVLVY